MPLGLTKLEEMSACQNYLCRQVTFLKFFSVWFTRQSQNESWPCVCVCVCDLSGCPPLQGTEGGQDNFINVLETAMKLANQDPDTEDDEEGGQSEAAKVGRGKSETQQSPFQAADSVSCSQESGIVAFFTNTRNVSLFAIPALRRGCWVVTVFSAAPAAIYCNLKSHALWLYRLHSSSTWILARG